MAQSMNSKRYPQKPTPPQSATTPATFATAQAKPAAPAVRQIAPPPTRFGGPAPAVQAKPAAASAQHFQPPTRFGSPTPSAHPKASAPTIQHGPGTPAAAQAKTMASGVQYCLPPTRFGPPPFAQTASSQSAVRASIQPKIQHFNGATPTHHPKPTDQHQQSNALVIQRMRSAFPLQIPSFNEELEIENGASAFQRADFTKLTKKTVVDDVNQTLNAHNYLPVYRKDYDIAHKVSFDTLRRVVMHYVMAEGDIGRSDLIDKTESLYTADKSRKGEMVRLRDELIYLVGKKKNTIDEATLKVIDKANELLHELNNASDNLGLGIPGVNRAIGAKFDLVVQNGSFTPRSGNIFNAFQEHTDFSYENGNAVIKDIMSSQITSSENMRNLPKKKYKVVRKRRY